ncbi:arsenic resistance protein [Salisediminibacterium beveridgei]|uniref:Arsenical-resistance protein ACR3 n=1 Tax=Salisediminibacterium beveridgei TaxID=632773 RepID=A0A1D7QT30_9BACI|nr:arsenic resistance protein [Salisediminibacterium beveridgei]AOM82160.1 Arsenical-resistance protein ACR3 [Salisediminibacterium beveridgei]
MHVLEKYYTVIIMACVLIGLALGQFSPVADGAGYFITPLLMVMLTLIFIQVPVSDIRKAFQNKRFSLTSVVINFIWTPILAWSLASIFLAEHPALFIGFIMLMVTPCTDWYLAFTNVSKGNLPLSTAILPVNLILQLVLLPVYLLLFVGTSGLMDPSELLWSILLVLVIPFLLAILFRYGRDLNAKIRRVTDIAVQLPVLFLALAILAMFTHQGQILLDNIHFLSWLLLPIGLFFLINYHISQRTGKVLQMPLADQRSLTLTTLARNSPVALAIALTAFDHEPMVALALIIGPLIELPVLSFISKLLQRQSH